MPYNKKQIPGLKSFIRFSEGLLEICFLSLIYYLVWRYGYAEPIFADYFGYGKYALAGVYALLTVVLFFSFDGFKFGYLRITDAILSQVISLFLANLITYLQLCLIANTPISAVPMLILMVVDTAAVLAFVVFYTWFYHRIYSSKKMAMVFGRDDAIALKFKMDTRPDKYRIDKLIPIEDGLERICEQIKDFDAVIINDVPSQIRNDILKFCYHNKIRTYVTPKLTDIIIRGAHTINLFDTPLLLVRGTGLTPLQRFVKRTMDLVLCLGAMVVAAPIMAVVAIAIKIEDGGPVFYKQARSSRNGKVFNILKFRSMVVDAEKDGHAVPATDDDPRITKVGRVIRASRIDELPQLLNIIKGDMSLVGPRPERLEHMEKYGREIPEFDFRGKVKGGLTGYAQVYGKYNTSAYDKIRLDLMYIENYSLLLDMKLILTTIRILFRKESTQGFDKAEELAHKKEELLQQVHDRREHDEASAEK